MFSCAESTLIPQQGTLVRFAEVRVKMWYRFVLVLTKEVFQEYEETCLFTIARFSASESL